MRTSATIRKYAVETSVFAPIVILAFCLVGISSASAGQPVCSSDNYVIYPGDTVRLHIVTDTSPPLTSEVRWEIDAGEVRQASDGWDWLLSGAVPGIYSANAVIAPDQECSVNVIVRLPPIIVRGGNERRTARSLLLHNEIEEAGYGLYSYVLLASHENDSNRELYLSTIQSFLEFPDAQDLETYISRYRKITKEEARKRINVAYVPVRKSPPEQILDMWENNEFPGVAEWVLANYDYARAGALLEMLGRESEEGPYLVSLLEPKGRSGNQKHLFQDQSNVPVELVSLWTRVFRYQAAKEEFWEESTLKNLMLRMRTWIAVAGKGLPIIEDEVIRW